MSRRPMEVSTFQNPSVLSPAEELSLAKPPRSVFNLGVSPVKRPAKRPAKRRPAKKSAPKRKPKRKGNPMDK